MYHLHRVASDISFSGMCDIHTIEITPTTIPSPHPTSPPTTATTSVLAGQTDADRHNRDSNENITTKEDNDENNEPEGNFQ